MRISRVYFEAQLQAGATVRLPAESAHYLAHVLRLRVDDHVHLFNARDGEFLVRITQIKKADVDVLVEKQVVQGQLVGGQLVKGQLAEGQLVRGQLAEEQLTENQGVNGQSRLKIHLGLGLSRGDRMDFAIQKSTELGVSEITPLYTEHGEVKLKADRLEKKLQHWRKIAINASEQSGRLEIPEIHTPSPLAEWQQGLDAGFSLMLDPSGEDKLPLNTAALQFEQVNLLIGPEGGFSATEIHSARNQGLVIVALGTRILRTETAPIAALAILQHLYGDM
ncbi:MAG: 16S rRNA (uracil(1498)-N(3))-methyltransferase [Pseudohongiella sp.]|nr:16S rRNA (uracil(1498)-N(3))-methyltransferase [Pseudohongiella sp.]